MNHNILSSYKALFAGLVVNYTKSDSSTVRGSLARIQLGIPSVCQPEHTMKCGPSSGLPQLCKVTHVQSPLAPYIVGVVASSLYCLHPALSSGCYQQESEVSTYR